jgi:uracil-DNA glycosylase family 4
LHALGIDVWVSKSEAFSLDTDSTETALEGIKADNAPQQRLMDALGAFWPSEDNQQTDWLLIMDAIINDNPLKQDSEQLLTEMLASIGLNYKQAFIIQVSEYPHADFDALKNQAFVTGLLSLQQQIERVGPKIILALGNTAANYLLQTSASITELRGLVHPFFIQSPSASAISTVVTYHPIHLLNAAQDKRLVWLDLQLAAHTYNH